ncbi:hypothetical protein RO3G_10941 [Rhizopus delemar RA 99-880]|uniref:Uncharacterized protein n=1 Tax=Rhizopus delemar (strain RA 99-880 / ATCC MYA-4621 / FGSC 9543 / NRRL 43880) TaxID=246409 RepID=I1CCQ0_RHIO9|nr:hypothetical protein RO3G_10941 [Rhizopus delemar RA 99-880]|eukprot:EIE86230.1 hypothetical protein RO3G_10941 [Rhizopus delemar RA 99-880]
MINTNKIQNFKCHVVRSSSVAFLGYFSYYWYMTRQSFREFVHRLEQTWTCNHTMELSIQIGDTFNRLHNYMNITRNSGFLGSIILDNDADLHEYSLQLDP